MALTQPDPRLQNRLCFGRLTVAELSAVDAIEQGSFSTPRSIAFYTRELTQNRLGAYWAVRPVDAEQPLPPVLAYGGYWLPGDEAHIVVIATHPDWRRHKLGEWLLLEMIAVVRRNGGASATLEVRHHNLAARHFYVGLGFVEVGVRKRYYRDTDEDAHLLTLFDLDDEASWQPLATRLATWRRCFVAAPCEAQDWQ